MKLWIVKRLTRKIEKDQERKIKFDYYSDCVSKAIERDTKRLNKMLKSLSRKDYIKYGFQTGSIDYPEYLIMMEKLEAEEEENG